MNKFFISILIFIFVSGITFAQDTITEMDEAVAALARNIHAKLAEKNAQKVIIGQLNFLDSIPPFSSYWVNQLTGELINMPRRNYVIIAGNAPDADWTITGEIVQAADVIRVYSRLIRLSDRAVEGVFSSNFLRDEHITDMILPGTGGAVSAGRDPYEPDSWESPVVYTIGTSSAAPVMNRALTEGDEDFFLLVPDRDGRLTLETTGSTDTYMHFYNYDSGEELASDDDSGQGTNAQIVHNVRGAVRYLAVVRGYNSSVTGAYGFRSFLTVREGAASRDNPHVYEIGIGEGNAVSVNRNLREGDEEYFLLVPDRDGRLTMETTGRIDTYMELYDEGTDELLDENDDGGNSYNARIRYNVYSGKRYIVLVRGYDSNVRGSFGFRAFFPGSVMLDADEYEPDDEPSLAKLIEIDSTQQRTFHSADDVDWVRFQITRQGRYTINARGENNNRLDTYIELYDSNLNMIAEDDDGGDGLSSRLSLNLGIGTYYLKVWCIDEEPDQGYLLSITSR
ncbi:MAG: hypothetical protein FWD40_12100 [Treponema sp.]|nr:hypothetical protein [Treponema sp.]